MGSETLLEKASLRAVVTLIILLFFLGSYAVMLKAADYAVIVDTDTFKLILQTLLTLLSVSVGGWLFRERESR
jgi:hypothetical protein